MTTNTHTPAWSRQVQPCATFWSFVSAFESGFFDDPQSEPPTEFALCTGDGWDPHPLLAAPGERRESVMMTGEIRDGRGYHPAATFVDCAMFRTRRAS